MTVQRLCDTFEQGILGDVFMEFCCSLVKLKIITVIYNVDKFAVTTVQNQSTVWQREVRRMTEM